MSTFEIHPDFQIELVAHEPTILDPVDMEFDAQGRVFVIEFPGYPFPERPGDVILLEDNDDDGVYETRTVWASGFPVATSLMPYEDGLLVASPPDILYLKDTNGDDKADHREVVLTGFAVDNQQHNISGLTLGLDHWIYVQNGGNSGRVHFPDDPDNTVSMRYDDLRFRWSTDESKPRTVERFGRTTGGFELAQDNYGRWFGTHNTQHIQQLVFPGKYLEGIPAPSHGSLANISDHEENGLARIYPIGKQETRVNHPEQSGYFSGACGITFYNGGQFGQFNDAMFICDVVLNLVHVDLLKDDGSPALTATRDPAHPKADFLASTDRAFRPVNATVGPDGALYILDMHREVIEHPEWIPDEIEENLDLNAGKDKGRIFRITPRGSTFASAAPNLNEMSSDALVSMLGTQNGWYRRTAQRLLIERNAIDMTNALEQRIQTGTKTSSIHAMWTLYELDALAEDSLISMIQYGDERTEQALTIAEETVTIPSRLASAILEKRPTSRRVRMLSALVLGPHFWDNYSIGTDYLKSMALQDGQDEWSRVAITSAADRLAGVMVMKLWQPQSYMPQEAKAELLATLSRSIGKRQDTVELNYALMFVSNDKQPLQLQLPQLEGLLRGLNETTVDAARIKKNEGVVTHVNTLMTSSNLEKRRAGWELARLLKMDPDPQQQAQIAASAKAAADASLPVEDRLAHLGITAYDTPENRVPLLFNLIKPLQPTPIQEEAIAQLASIRDTAIAEQLVERWDTIGPAIRRAASNILLYQRQNHDILLTALENGVLTLGEMNFHLERRRTLLHSRDEDIVARAEKLFSDAGVVTRKEAMDAMRPALELNGDPIKGQQIFTGLCANCHTIGSEGANLGPNLTEIYRKSAETLLHDIVDPNAGAELQYITYNVETNDGQFHSGIVIADDADGVTLRDAEGEYFVARSDIKEFFSSGLSLMPEELEVGLDPQDMADLLAFLQEPK